MPKTDLEIHINTQGLYKLLVNYRLARKALENATTPQASLRMKEAVKVAEDALSADHEWLWDCNLDKLTERLGRDFAAGGKYGEIIEYSFGGSGRPRSVSMARLQLIKNRHKQLKRNKLKG